MLDTKMQTELETEGVAIVNRATTIVVTDDHSYGQAAEILKQARSLDKQAVAFVAPLTAATKAAHDESLALEKKLRAPFQLAIASIPRVIGAYEAQQRRLKEQERQQAEEALRKQEESRRLAEAERLEKAGKVAEAMAFLDAPISVPSVVPEPAVPKVEGLAFRDSWKALVTDLGALIAFVAANPQFQNLLLANEVALNQFARSQKSGMQIPGVEAVVERIPMTR